MKSGSDALFGERFGGEPRWRSRAPGRVNLIGEHVDYMGGLVLPAAVDRFIWLSGAPARRWELASEVDGGEDYLRAIAAELGAGPQRVAAAATLPAGFGMSSSAALLVAAAAGLEPELDGREAALACQRAEQKATGVMVGVMDQFASAMGKQGHAILLDCASLDFRYVPFPGAMLIVVIDSGVRRELADTPYNQRRREAEAGMPKRVRHVESEIQRVRDFTVALEAGDGARCGELLKESHRSLRDDFEVSTPEVDAIVERGWAIPGCFGARIMGAGFGGSILALVERGAEADFEAAIGAPTVVCATADGAFVQ
ncbi:MAG TPA: galactokinase family protein [Candidatus Dormibacteraeota bacterium]